MVRRRKPPESGARRPFAERPSANFVAGQNGSDRAPNQTRNTRLESTREREDLRGGRGLARNRRRRRRPPRRRGRLDPHTRRGRRLRRLRRALRARRAPHPRRLHRLGRHEADAPAPRRQARTGPAPTSPRTASTTSRPAAPSRSSSSTTSPRTGSRPSSSPSSSRARPESAARPAARSIGGETAELPGIYRDEEFDFAGTCVGLVEREDLIDGSKCEAGDVVVGFRSAGLHANGFTLVRSLVGDDDFDADLLLPPTRLYLDEIRALRGRVEVRALAHITGGGIPGNLVRVLPEGVRAVIDPTAWERGPRLRLARRAGRRRGGAAPRLQPRDRHVRRRLRPRRLGPHDLVIGRLERGEREVVLRVIGVLVSGIGTNLQALIDDGLPVSRRHLLEPGRARARARRARRASRTRRFALEDHADRDLRDAAMADWLEERGVELVVLAGFMWLLRRPFLERFPTDRSTRIRRSSPRSPARPRSRTRSRTAPAGPARPSTTSRRADSTPARSSFKSRSRLPTTTRWSRCARRSRPSSTPPPGGVPARSSPGRCSCAEGSRRVRIAQ